MTSYRLCLAKCTANAWKYQGATLLDKIILCKHRFGEHGPKRALGMKSGAQVSAEAQVIALHVPELALNRLKRLHVHTSPSKTGTYSSWPSFGHVTKVVVQDFRAHHTCTRSGSPYGAGRT